MSQASKLVRTRTPGRCDALFAHPDTISVGDIVRVTVTFPGHDIVHPWTRSRECNWCVRRDCKLYHPAGYVCPECGYVKPRASWRDPETTARVSIEPRKMRDLTTMGNIIGVGYEGLDLDSLVSRLRLRDVTTVVDVRLNPISRKRGLSKSALAARLQAEGITYEHIPALGNPRDNREGFATTDSSEGREARDKFDEILDTPAAKAALDQVLDLADAGTVALLCFEQDETRCHRELVLNALHGLLVNA